MIVDRNGKPIEAFQDADAVNLAGDWAGPTVRLKLLRYWDRYPPGTTLDCAPNMARTLLRTERAERTGT